MNDRTLTGESRERLVNAGVTRTIGQRLRAIVARRRMPGKRAAAAVKGTSSQRT
jgi:hypothetical protein